jgi:hypothetical protein
MGWWRRQIEAEVRRQTWLREQREQAERMLAGLVRDGAVQASGTRQCRQAQWRRNRVLPLAPA